MQCVRYAHDLHRAGGTPVALSGLEGKPAMKRVWVVIRDASSRWVDDECYRLAAALAFYTFFSIFPLLLIFVTVLGYFVGHDPELRTRIVSMVGGGSTPEARVLIEQTLENMRHHQTAGGVGAVLGFLALLFGASGGFGELEAAFHKIWRVPPAPTKKLTTMIVEAVRDRAIAFALVLGAGVLLIASLVASTILGTLDRSARSIVPYAWVWQWVETATSIGFLSLVFAAIFKTVPRTLVAWRDVGWGALFTALGVTLMKRLFAWYLSSLTSYAAYGAVGAVLALLTWIYLLSSLLFLGAEMTRVYAEHYGSLSIEPSRPLEKEREPVSDRPREPGARPERHSLT